ncbi:gustatory and pheromone receptor 32a [Aphis gossypii]|uniref:gustatory and pheromone receptor 32a n=1 Tax=Aphis gossypii TaxID=80765 RepID=UPI002158B91C|nr:gustatory and pheromone receptor 32a [Aphis gossypii]
MYYPMDIYKANFRIFVIIMVSLCAILILPVNGLRIYLLYDQFRDSAMVLFFSIMYLQNISLCVTELQFIAYCFGLYLKYRSINEDMAILKSRTITINRYPSALNPGKYNSICDSSGSNYDICQTIKECQLVNSIESFRMRHRFVSDSVNDLNDIYSIQIGLSLFILLVMALFDIYEVVLTEYNIFQTYEMLLMWLSQYAFRFSMIVLTTHFTTKQANKSKMILTDINNRYTDYNTKEELRLFLKELCSRSMEFTTYDLFLLNTRTITSAIVAGTTYLIIFLQFR